MTTKTFSRVEIKIYDSRGEQLNLSLREKQYTAKDVLVEVGDWLATVTAPEDWITPEKVVVQSNPPREQTHVPDQSTVKEESDHEGPTGSQP